MQELSNSAWACATLADVHIPLLDAIAARSNAILPGELEQAIMYSKGDLEMALLFEMNMGELAWSYTFVSQANRPFLKDVKSACLEVGRAFDKHHMFWDLHPGVRCALPCTPPTVEEPTILHLLVGMCLVLKPPGWEVDSEGNSGLRHLSGFIQARLPLDRRAVAFRPDFGFGFIHRLDTPSSGLILTATSFEGYCCLEWQMYTYEIAREYFVVGHGMLKVPTWNVEKRILDTKIATVAGNGRPAESHISFIADIGLIDQTKLEEGFCIVDIRIHTGRRHQIRVHMRYCECPSVADSRYNPDRAVFIRPFVCISLLARLNACTFGLDSGLKQHEAHSDRLS